MHYKNEIEIKQENQKDDLSSLFNELGEIIGIPQSMFGDSLDYSLQVRKDLEQYGKLVYDESIETIERFKKLLGYWRPNNHCRVYCFENPDYFYDQAEEMGLVEDEVVSKYVAVPILKFMAEHDVDNSFMQKMFNEIWRDTGSFNMINDDQQGAVISNEIAEGLMSIAQKLFGHNGTFDITDVSALYIFETALSHARDYSYISDENIIDEINNLSTDEFISKLILTCCKDIVVYWSKLENIKRIPVEKRSDLFKLFHYIKNPENDLNIEQLKNLQLPLVLENKLSTYINPYALIQQNLKQATIDTLDGDYMDYNWRVDDNKNKSKIPKPYCYYNMQERLELAKFMPDNEACQYYMKLIKWRETHYKDKYIDSVDYENVKMFRLIADRTSDPKLKIEYIKKWLQFDKHEGQIYVGINDEFLLFADDIKRKIIPADIVPTLDKEHQDVAILIIERTSDLDGMIKVQGKNPYETAQTDLSKRALKAIVEYYSKKKYEDYDKLLSAIDIVLQSNNHAVSAKRMREVLVSFYSKIKKTYNKHAKEDFYVKSPEVLETAKFTLKKHVLELYLSRLTEQMKIEGQMQKSILKADSEIVKPEILKLTKIIRQVALNKSQLDK